LGAEGWRAIKIKYKGKIQLCCLGVHPWRQIVLVIKDIKGRQIQREALTSNGNKGLIFTNKWLLKMDQDQTTKMKESASFVMMESKKR